MPDQLRLIAPAGIRPKVGIVHLGPGAFFRAFNAIYTDEAMAVEAGDWSICAVSLQSSTARDQLLPQGCCYTSVSLGVVEKNYQMITSITDILVASEDPSTVLQRMIDPDVKIVSLTITEKGYCHEPTTRRLNLSDPDIIKDLARPEIPVTALGFLVEALRQRWRNGTRPFTILSCDNLPSNGALVRRLVLEFAEIRDPKLALWIKVEACFPSTMVDRITPATTPKDIAHLADDIGYYDPACVQHESFRQWVIEDTFVDGNRPAWDAVGVQFVKDVVAHENMKLRCLNGTHSSLAYLGYLAGYETIFETIADPDFSAFCTRLWHKEIIPSILQPEGEDPVVYCATLLERYQNSAIQHRTYQIAMDGSQKLPQRLLATILDNLKSGRSISGLSLAVAAWMRYVGGLDEKGQIIDVLDPMATQLRATLDGANSATEKVASLLKISDIFDPSLVKNTVFCDSVTKAYQGLVKRGAKVMVMELVQ